MGGVTSVETTNPMHANEPLDDRRPFHERGPPLRFNPDDIYFPEPDGPPSNVGGVLSVETTNPLHAKEPLDDPRPSHERAPHRV